MASANAIPSTASVMTFPNAPGLRPTASEAFIPTRPTPMAEPRPHKPTWILPLISANIGVTITFPFFCFVVAQRLPRLNMVQPLKFFRSVLLLMRAYQRCEHRRKQHEHKGLNQTDENFQKVKRHRQEDREHSLGPRGMLNRPRQRLQQVFTGKNVSVEPEAQRDRPKPNR